ncbi:hypothetical protein NLU13_6357 [Sarocladium strictum]|uniref:Uncharacterized protein n=1 Tax=Sarocladium strictum TaxID=5046 RepID=A0AA39L727_SARSR|nr:hypothetical protein NLU13_6357 [Sarocladium strictum]
MAERGVPDDIARLSLGQASDPETPPAPRMDAEGIIAQDVTAKFSEAVKTLAPGELVKDPFFTLFESVAALEIMDPKMDSGCVDAGEEFEETYDVSRSLRPEEVIGIIDELICHEMSWHMGYPLSQTVLTSVYVEALSMPDPRNIQEAAFIRGDSDVSETPPMSQILRAYCLGMLKGCLYVNERIRGEHFYEEEDFVTNTYNRTLLASVPISAIREVLQDARRLLSSLRGSSVSLELIEALDNRLELRQIFLDVAETPNHRNDPENARRPWTNGLPILAKLGVTHKLAQPVTEAFSVKLQRKLASTMPPRPIVQLSFQDALGHFTRLFQDGEQMIDVLNFHDTQSLQMFVSTFQAKKPQPLVYVRTLLQTFLFNEMEFLGTMSIRQILDDDFSIVTLPASPLLDRANDEIEAPQDVRFDMAGQMEAFRQRAAQPFLDILRTFCQNRCRVRRTLCHIVREWENLQFDAEEIDQILQVRCKEQPVPLPGANGVAVSSHALPLSSWTYFYKLRQMEWIVQFGFELEVYQPDELAGMYWYLNYLAKCRVQHTERIRSFLVHRAGEQKTQGKDQDSKQQKELDRALSFSRLSMLEAAVTWELSDALSCLYTIIHRYKLLKLPSRPYGSDELRYELRMKPFVSIGLPDLPSFQDFTLGTTQPGTPTEDILAYGERALAGAKRGFEALSKFSAEESFSVGCHDRWVASMKNGLKSCIAAGIAFSTLQKAVREVGGAEGGLKLQAEVPTPAKSYHEWWIVPRISPTRQ